MKINFILKITSKAYTKNIKIKNNVQVSNKMLQTIISKSQTKNRNSFKVLDLVLENLTHSIIFDSSNMKPHSSHSLSDG